MSAHIAPLSRDEISADALASLRESFPRARALLETRPDAPPLPPILGLLARHTGIAGPWLTFNGALLDHGLLDSRARELVLLAVVDRAECSYLWSEHVRIARAAGVTSNEIAALERRERSGWPPLETALLHSVDELVDGHELSDGTWQQLAGHFDERQLLELLFVIGTYTCLAIVLNGAGLTAGNSA